MASTAHEKSGEKLPPLPSSSLLLSPASSSSSSSSSDAIKNDTVIFIKDRHESNGMEFGGRPLAFIRTSSSKSGCEMTFMSLLAGNRIVKNDIKLSKEESSHPIPEQIVEQGRTFEVVSSKHLEDGESGGIYCKPKKIRLYYLITVGPGLDPINAKAWLESIGDFESLSTRKAVSRLELFQSPAAPLLTKSAAKKCADPTEEFMKKLDEDFFVDIEEKGHTGCGFICEELLKDLLKGAPKVDEKKVICGQIRIFVPSKGTYKGMLQKKQMPPEYKNKILLPKSLKKIGPVRRKKEGRQVGYLMFCKAGFDPSSYNKNLGKLINRISNDTDDNGKDEDQDKDNNRNPEPPPSFIPKEMSDTYIKLLISLGVPEKMLMKYVRNATRKKNETRIPKCHHICLRGTNDPTGKIPPNHVFLTGFRDRSIVGDTVFITRNPCIKPSDGCLVKVVTEKPEGMTDEEFEWLNELELGVVMFGMPSEGMKPLPERIANGDLDGDRFFILWDKMILDSIDLNVIEDEEPMLREELDNGNSSSLKSDDEWFRKVQAAMVDVKAMNMWNLVGMLYAACMKVAKNDPERLLKNPDAMAFGDAYKQAIDNGKHGTIIFLPLHLWAEIPRGFHQYLQTMEGIKFGSLVEKDFGSEGTFVGEVQEYRHDKDSEGHYLKVAYEDGDSEEFTLEELKRLKPYKGPRPTVWAKKFSRQPRQNPPSPRKRQKDSSSASSKRQTNGKIKKRPPAKRHQTKKNLSKKSQKNKPTPKPKPVKLTLYEREMNQAFLNSLIGTCSSKAGNSANSPSNPKKHQELQDGMEQKKSHSPCDISSEMLITSEENDNGGGGDKDSSVKKTAHERAKKRKKLPLAKKSHRKSLSLPKKPVTKKRKTKRKRMTRYERELNLAGWNSLIDLERSSGTPAQSGKDDSVGAAANNKNQGFSDLNASTADKDKPFADVSEEEVHVGHNDHTRIHVIAGVTTANNDVSSDDDDGDNRQHVNTNSFEEDEEDSCRGKYVGFGFVDNNQSSTSDPPCAPSISTITITPTPPATPRVNSNIHIKRKPPTHEGLISITYQVDDYGEMTPSEIIPYGGTSSLSLCDTIAEELELRDPNLPRAGAALERIYRIRLSSNTAGGGGGDAIEYDAEMMRKRSIGDLLDVTGTKLEHHLSIEAKYREVLSSANISTITTASGRPPLSSSPRGKSEIPTSTSTSTKILTTPHHEGVIHIKYHIDDYGETTPAEIIPYGGSTSSLSRCDTILEELEWRDPNLPCAGAALERIYEVYLPTNSSSSPGGGGGGGVTSFEYDADMLRKRSIGDFLDVTGGTQNLRIVAKYREILPASCLRRLTD